MYIYIHIYSICSCIYLYLYLYFFHIFSKGNITCFHPISEERKRVSSNISLQTAVNSASNHIDETVKRDD